MDSPPELAATRNEELLDLLGLAHAFLALHERADG